MGSSRTVTKRMVSSCCFSTDSQNLRKRGSSALDRISWSEGSGSELNAGREARGGGRQCTVTKKSKANVMSALQRSPSQPHEPPRRDRRQDFRQILESRQILREENPTERTPIHWRWYRLFQKDRSGSGSENAVLTRPRLRGGRAGRADVRDSDLRLYERFRFRHGTCNDPTPTPIATPPFPRHTIDLDFREVRDPNHLFETAESKRRPPQHFLNRRVCAASAPTTKICGSEAARRWKGSRGRRGAAAS